MRGRRLHGRATKWLSRLVRPRVRRVGAAAGIVSFTFDDFPKSALEIGGRILEAHGVRGTYYTCMGLAGKSGTTEPLSDADDVRTAHRAGHEIACHTFSHIDCGAANAARVVDDIARNAEALAGVLGAFAPANFAYPFAQPAIGAKLALLKQFQSCRGGRPGINAGRVDFGELRANEIRHAQHIEEEACTLIDRNRESGGWLIFYTHDVGERPSPFGCTGAELNSIVAYAASRSRVLPVRDAVAAIGGVS